MLRRGTKRLDTCSEAPGHFLNPEPWIEGTYWNTVTLYYYFHLLFSLVQAISNGCSWISPDNSGNLWMMWKLHLFGSMWTWAETVLPHWDHRRLECEKGHGTYLYNINASRSNHQPTAMMRKSLSEYGPASQLLTALVAPSKHLFFLAQVHKSINTPRGWSLRDIYLKQRRQSMIRNEYLGKLYISCSCCATRIFMDYQWLW